jgi:hypothetical protein
LRLPIPRLGPKKESGGPEAAARSAPAKLIGQFPLMTVTARRFCDQQEMSSHVATGRSLPYEIVRMRFAAMPCDVM